MNPIAVFAALSVLCGYLGVNTDKYDGLLFFLCFVFFLLMAATIGAMWDKQNRDKD